MSVTMPETPVATTQHPTDCPAWCKHRRSPMGHDFGPTSTVHVGPEMLLPNPTPDQNGERAFTRAELYRFDEDHEPGRTVLYVSGESEADLNRDEAEVLAAQAQALADALRVAVRQMAGA